MFSVFTHSKTKTTTTATAETIENCEIGRKFKMFWDKGYTPSQNIEALLQKENSTVEEFLDDDDILQECKTLKKSIVKYFTRPDVIKHLIEIITTEPSEELPLAQRFRHANMACEILTLGMPYLDEKIIADPETLKILYSYLENEPPLNPLLSSFFQKTFCMLFTKKPEQDWFLYQQMCLQLLEYLKSRKDFLDLIFKHFATPVIPEMVLQLLRDFEGGQLKRNLYEWLTEEKLVERLIAILGNPEECDKHSNVTEFLCDLIKTGRAMRQTEHENDSFEPAFDGSNPILKTIESEIAIEALLNVILEHNAQESAIVSAITVVLTLIKPNTIVDEVYSDRSKLIQNREKEIHEQIATTVIRVMTPRLNELNQLLKTPPTMPSINTTAAKLEPPFGVTRLQVCRVFTVLLQMKNEEIEKAICETDFFETLLTLFKQYCWNNFLHSEVEKCMQIIFETASSSNNNNSAQGSTIVNDGSISKSSLNGDSNGISSNFFDCMITNGVAENTNESNITAAVTGDNDVLGSSDNSNVNASGKNTFNVNEENDIKTNMNNEGDGDGDIAAVPKELETSINNENNELEPEKEMDLDKNISVTTTVEMSEMNENEDLEIDQAQTDTKNNASVIEKMEESTEEHSLREKESMKSPTDNSPSALQKHLITNCKLITKLIDFWKYNIDMESAEKGRRLGYMGYLIKTLRHITNCISESEHIGALIESNLSDESEIEKWKSITDAKDGDLTKALTTQNRLLANCNAHEACDFGHHLAKDLLGDNSTWEYVMTSNMLNNLGGFSDSNYIDASHDEALNYVGDDAPIDFNMFQFDNNFKLEDEDDEDELVGAIGGIAAGSAMGSTSDGSMSFFSKSSKPTTSGLNSLSSGFGNGLCSIPWYDVDPFANLKVNSSPVGPWTSDFTSDNFADFDSHFSTFTNDLGESLTASKENNLLTAGDGKENERIGETNKINTELDAAEVGFKNLQEFDNNANVEKLPITFDDLALKNDVASNLDRNNEKQDDDAVPPSLVRTLRSVMQESEDDYEDDDGMWTKPLGQSANQSFDMDAEGDVKLKSPIDTTMLNGTTQDEDAENQWPTKTEIEQNETKLTEVEPNEETTKTANTSEGNIDAEMPDAKKVISSLASKANPADNGDQVKCSNTS